jgi:glycosyltransferase involved in cell wall biosynthesis
VPTAKKRILWLHTQPESYHNLMLDHLARGGGYRLPGMPDEHSDEFEWIAGFAHRGPGLYSENALSCTAQTLFLRVLPGKESRFPKMYESYHVDWRADLRALGTAPLGPDAIIVSGYAFRSAREIIAACHATGTPVALWSDSNLRADRGRHLKTRAKRCLKRLLVRPIARSVDCLLTANSRGVAYWRYYGGPRAREKTLLDACYSNYQLIDQARTLNRADVLARFQLNPSDKILLTSARLVPAKGLDLLIRAFREGHFAQRGWKYILAGSGSAEAELRALAGPDADRSILFLGFQQPSDNLALMAHADLFALPSRFEPHGIVVGEALAAGTPVLASSVVGAACDLVRQGESGALFRSEDYVDLQRHLALLDDPAKLVALRPGARRAFESWYRQTSPLVVVPRMIRRLLAQKGSQPA